MIKLKTKKTILKSNKKLPRSYPQEREQLHFVTCFGNDHGKLTQQS